jgi:chemotaxis signal transduction protein
MSARAQSYVLFPLGAKRFALPAEVVTELAKPDTLQSFPHATPLLTGVLLRRGRVVPVCDVAPVLIGPNAPARKFYLIANRKFQSGSEWTAIPVTGECELVNSEALPATGRLPHYVEGLLSLQDEIVEVVSLEKISSGETGSPARASRDGVEGARA